MSAEHTMEITVLTKKISDLIANWPVHEKSCYYGRINSSLHWNLDFGRLALPPMGEMVRALEKLRSGYSTLKMEIKSIDYVSPSECCIKVVFEKYRHENVEDAQERIRETFAEVFYPFVETPKCHCADQGYSVIDSDM